MVLKGDSGTLMQTTAQNTPHQLAETQATMHAADSVVSSFRQVAQAAMQRAQMAQQQEQFAAQQEMAERQLESQVEFRRSQMKQAEAAARMNAQSMKAGMALQQEQVRAASIANDIAAFDYLERVALANRQPEPVSDILGGHTIFGEEGGPQYMLGPRGRRLPVTPDMVKRLRDMREAETAYKGQGIEIRRQELAYRKQRDAEDRAMREKALDALMERHSTDIGLKGKKSEFDAVRAYAADKLKAASQKDIGGMRRPDALRFEAEAEGAMIAWSHGIPLKVYTTLVAEVGVEEAINRITTRQRPGK